LGNIRLIDAKVVTVKTHNGAKVWRRLSPLLILAVIACGGRSSAADQAQTPPPSVPARPLYTSPLAGEKVAVLPITMIIAEPPLSSETPFIDRITALRWADSLLQYALENRAPDVSWVFPEDLRAIAKRAPTVAPDPDKMGQSIMAAPRLDFMPDPLRSYARSLVAIAGGRHVLIPAAATFSRPPSGGVKIEFSIVMADARNGRVIWRTLAVGEGQTVAAAVSEALRVMLPLPSGTR
jgi:hypothetical protein